MGYVSDEIREFADSRETSKEVAAAIFFIAQAGDEDRMWSDPSADEMSVVEAVAWRLADAEINELHWGCERIHRPSGQQVGN